MIIVPIVGDTHTNSTIGLCPPYVELDDGGSYKSSDLQREIWRAWSEFNSDLAELKQVHNAKVCTIFNGDISDGDHHNTSQIITRKESAMLRMAYKAHEPLISQSDRVYVVRGTRGHSGASGGLEETFAEDIEAVQNAKTKAYSWWHLSLNVDGVILDIAHHNTMGRLPWTIKNASNKLASKVLFEYANRKVRIPDLVVRSHQHRHADSHDSFRIRAICLPAWQGKTEWISQIDPSSIPDIGGIFVLCEGGEYEVITKLYPLRRSPPMKVEF
jgi:hypothetical protein